MSPNFYVIGIMALAMLNGIFSPFAVFTARIIILALAPALPVAGATLVAFFASLLAATATLVIAGVPAALFERATGRTESDPASYAIWLVTTAVLAFPALTRALALAL